MPSFSFLGKLMFWRKVKDLETLLREIDGIKNNIGVATNSREEIFDKIWASCENLKKNPWGKKERRVLSMYLHRERIFLHNVRQGIKNGLGVLEVTLKKLKNAKIAADEKAVMLRDLQFVIDAMQFVKGKIKTIESRGKMEEVLITGDYEVRHINQFLQVMRDEVHIDIEIGDFLEGKSETVIKELNSWRFRLKDMGISVPAVTIPSVLGSPIVYIRLAESGYKNPDEVTGTIFLIMGIIAASVGIFHYLSKSTQGYEESRRAGRGKVGMVLDIPK